MSHDLTNRITKMIFDAIWNSRVDRRETLVKKVVENHFEAFKQLKEDKKRLKNVLKDLKDLEKAH